MHIIHKVSNVSNLYSTCYGKVLHNFNRDKLQNYACRKRGVASYVTLGVILQFQEYEEYLHPIAVNHSHKLVQVWRQISSPGFWWASYSHWQVPGRYVRGFSFKTSTKKPCLIKSSKASTLNRRTITTIFLSTVERMTTCYFITPSAKAKTIWYFGYSLQRSLILAGFWDSKQEWCIRWDC